MVKVEHFNLNYYYSDISKLVEKYNSDTTIKFVQPNTSDNWFLS